MTDLASQELLLACSRSLAAAIADMVGTTQASAKTLKDGQQMKSLLVIFFVCPYFLKKKHTTNNNNNKLIFNEFGSIFCYDETLECIKVVEEER